MYLQELLANVETLIHTTPYLAFAAVFLGGALTASSPCVLAMIPLVIGFVGGYDSLSGWKRSLGFSLIFVFGLAISFTLMGLIAVTLGRLFGDVGGFWPWVIAFICLGMGTHLWGFWDFSMPQRLVNFRPTRGGAIGAFLLGMLFGLVSAPCAAPILVVVLTYIAAKGNMLYGLSLLWTYAVGHCLLIVAAGTSVGVAKGLVASTGFVRANALLKKIAGILIIAVGIYILVNAYA